MPTLIFQEIHRLNKENGMEGGEDRIVTGYDYIDGELIINNYESACVRYIFNQHEKGSGLRKVFEKTDAKYPGIISGKSTASKILRNPIYISKIRYKGELYASIHDPIISEKQLENAEQKRIERQDIAERNAIEGKFGEGKRKYGLGLIPARLKQTSETVIILQFLIMNIKKVL